MKAFVVGIAGVSVAMMVAAPAGAIPDTNCELVTPVTAVTSVSQLPDPLKKLIGPIADIGAPFNSTDDVDDPSLPFRRLNQPQAEFIIGIIKAQYDTRNV